MCYLYTTNFYSARMFSIVAAVPCANVLSGVGCSVIIYVQAMKHQARQCCCRTGVIAL